jgi:hypothetical protein
MSRKYVIARAVVLCLALGPSCYPGDGECTAIFTDACIPNDPIEEVIVPGSRDQPTGCPGCFGQIPPTTSPGLPPGETPSNNTPAPEPSGPVAVTTGAMGETILTFQEFKFKVVFLKATVDGLGADKLNAIVSALTRYQNSPTLTRALQAINARPQTTTVEFHYSDKVQLGNGRSADFTQDNPVAQIANSPSTLYITLNKTFQSKDVSLRSNSGSAVRLAVLASIHELIHPSVNGDRPATPAEEQRVARMAERAVNDLLRFDEFDYLDSADVNALRQRCMPIERQCIIFQQQVNITCHRCDGSGLEYIRTCIGQYDASCLSVLPTTEDLAICPALEPEETPCLFPGGFPQQSEFF